jgi:DNA-directed RNA polymerase specialized sigma24 family protein
VCVLHYLLDQSVETIAEGLGVSDGTIKTQLFRARKALAAQLRREDHHG